MKVVRILVYTGDPEAIKANLSMAYLGGMGAAKEHRDGTARQYTIEEIFRGSVDEPKVDILKDPESFFRARGDRNDE